MTHLAWPLALIGLFGSVTALHAQAAPTADAAPPAASAITGATSAMIVRNETTSDETPTSLLADQRSGRRAPPFGAELFRQPPPAAGGPILDPAYVMKPGDTVSVSQWGLVNSTTQTVVDPRGNIVVPGLGPIEIGGLAANQVNDKVRSAAGATYRSNVQTYAAPLSATTMQVFVTGPVMHPGFYAGSSADSVIGFLQRAGGPDPDRGSYRHIIVRRAGRAIVTADLYAFLIDGTLPDVHLQQGDVIVVGPQGPIVTVSGDARAPYTFELRDAVGQGSELLRYARPRPEVTDASLFAIRSAKPTNLVLPLASFAAQPLADGDRVRFEANGRADTYVVQVEGAVDGARSFVVPRGARLDTVLAQLHYDPLADSAMIHLRRVSAAAVQKQLLVDDLARLEKAIYTTPSRSSSAAQARQVDIAGLQQFIQRARSVQPEGLVSLRGIDPRQVILEPDDVIVVPYISQTVIIGGEVALPQSLIASESRPVDDYIQRAGGFSERAARGNVLVISADSAAHVGGAVRPGDRVLVPPKVSSPLFDLILSISTIAYQLGVAAAAVLR